jgi:hypothetical protein
MSAKRNGGLAAPARYIFDTSKAATDTRLQSGLQAQRERETRRLRWARYVQRICNLGAPRIWFELLDALDRRHDLGDDLDHQLDRFADLDPDLLRELGTDKLPLPPVHLVRGDR